MEIDAMPEIPVTNYGIGEENESESGQERLYIMREQHIESLQRFFAELMNNKGIELLTVTELRIR